MPTFLIPIEGLTTVADWQLGALTVRPAADALSQAGHGESPGNVEWFDKLVAEQASGAFATVAADDLDAAIDLVAQAVDVLRVLQHVRHFTSELTQFGIAGDVGRGAVPYIRLEDGRKGQGFSHRGSALGWTFSDPDEWTSAHVFQWAASAIGARSADEAQRRALIGIQCSHRL